MGIERPTKPELEAWIIRLRERNLTPGGVNMYIRTIKFLPDVAGERTWDDEDQAQAPEVATEAARTPFPARDQIDSRVQTVEQRGASSEGPHSPDARHGR